MTQKVLITIIMIQQVMICLMLLAEVCEVFHVQLDHPLARHALPVVLQRGPAAAAGRHIIYIYIYTYTYIYIYIYIHTYTYHIHICFWDLSPLL